MSSAPQPSMAHIFWVSALISHDSIAVIATMQVQLEAFWKWGSSKSQDSRNLRNQTSEAPVWCSGEKG
jgi:hypothetical protein